MREFPPPHPTILTRSNRPRTCTRCVLVEQQRRLDEIQRLIEAQPALIARTVVQAGKAAALHAARDTRRSQSHGLRAWLSNWLFRLALRIHPNFPRAARR